MTTTMNPRSESQREMSSSPKREASGAESTRPGPVFTPAVDILESATAITVLADMPGVRADTLDIDLRDNVLSIEGAVPRPAAAAGEQVLAREYETGSFRREFRLTSRIDQDEIDASLHDGVLRLVLPKAKSAQPRRIAVRTG